MAATYVVGSSYIRLLGSPLSDLGTPLCNIYLLSNHVMKTQTYCSCIILMIVRYIQCINNIEGNILDISLSLSTTKKIRRKDYPAGRTTCVARFALPVKTKCARSPPPRDDPGTIARSPTSRNHRVRMIRDLPERSPQTPLSLYFFRLFPIGTNHG